MRIFDFGILILRVYHNIEVCTNICTELILLSSEIYVWKRESFPFLSSTSMERRCRRWICILYFEFAAKE